MNTTSSKLSQRGPAEMDEPRFTFHPSFEEFDAERTYGSPPAVDEEWRGFMPDELTREWTKRMCYAAWRISTGLNRRGTARWRKRYYDCRDRVVLGNRKLTFRAVQKWSPAPQLAEDMASECQIVLLKAVAAFNPWMGVRFSTYAFTCLMRALSRISQRQAADRLAHWIPIGSIPHGEPCNAVSEETTTPAIARLEQYLRPEHGLLTPREKTVLIKRYHLQAGAGEAETLEQVGRELGLSKERVRQVQSTALGKLRATLLAGTPNS